MEEAFWQSRWDTGRIGFHEGAPNALLTAHFEALGGPHPAHVFVPLCGKSHDLDWLLDQGHRVSGIEFNRGAVDAVFDRLGLRADVLETADLKRYSAGDLTLWQGDVFALSQDALVDAARRPVDLIYDRAALVALPKDLRRAYAAHLQVLAPKAQHLLISFDYDQSQTDGPPFSVPKHEIQNLYGAGFEIAPLASQAITGALAQRCSGQEQVWRLRPQKPAPADAR